MLIAIVNTLTSAGDRDIYVLKLDTSGGVLYAAQAGGTGLDSGIDIAVDGGGQAYVTGYFAGNATFGSVNLTSASTYSGFIAQIDASGNFTWARQAANATDQSLAQVQGIAVGASGCARGREYLGPTGLPQYADDLVIFAVK